MTTNSGDVLLYQQLGVAVDLNACTALYTRVRALRANSLALYLEEGIVGFFS